MDKRGNRIAHELELSGQMSSYTKILHIYETLKLDEYFCNLMHIL